jgi:salicylate hydroxylase
MLPHQGQGGAQGLEDGVVMGIVMSGAQTAEDIEARLALFEKIRRSRASSIQIMSNVGQDQNHLVKKELLEFIPEEKIPCKFLRAGRSWTTCITLFIFFVLTVLTKPGSPADQYLYCYGYDAVEHALGVMKEYDPSFELCSQFFSGT